MKNIDPSEINIINYLTGEMSAEEIIQFEKQLNKNELMQSQIEEMKKIQSQMGVWDNQDIEVPDYNDLMSPSTIKGDGIGQPLNMKGRSRFSIPLWARYAAVFLGFVLFLQIIGLEVSQKGNALMVSFGEPELEHLDESDVDRIVAKALDNYTQNQSRDFVNFKNQVNSNLGQLSNSVNQIAASNKMDIHQLKNFLDRNLEDQYANIQLTIKDNDNTQRQEMEDSFTSLVEYLDNNRVKDQLKIQNAFSDIATAINNQNYQTNALLTSISSEDTGLKSY